MMDRVNGNISYFGKFSKVDYDMISLSKPRSTSVTDS